MKLTHEEASYLEEPYVPHLIVGSINKEPAFSIGSCHRGLLSQTYYRQNQQLEEVYPPHLIIDFS